MALTPVRPLRHPRRFIRDGIGYTPTSVRDARLEALREADANQQRSLELRSRAERGLAQDVRSRLRAWLLGDQQPHHQQQYQDQEHHSRSGSGGNGGVSVSGEGQGQGHGGELQVPLPGSKRGRALVKLLIQQEFQLPSLGYDAFSMEEVKEGGEAEGDSDAEGDGEGSEGSDGRGGYLLLRRLGPGEGAAGLGGARQTPLSARQMMELAVEASGFAQVRSRMGSDWGVHGQFLSRRAIARS